MEYCPYIKYIEGCAPGETKEHMPRGIQREAHYAPKLQVRTVTGRARAP